MVVSFAKKDDCVTFWLETKRKGESSVSLSSAFSSYSFCWCASVASDKILLINSIIYETRIFLYSSGGSENLNNLNKRQYYCLQPGSALFHFMWSAIDKFFSLSLCVSVSLFVSLSLSVSLCLSLCLSLSLSLSNNQNCECKFTPILNF